MAPPSQIRFHYIKSPQFRVIHVDGGIGSQTPTGNVHCAIYSERPAIPQEVEYQIAADGTLGKEVAEARVGRNGIVRELEADLVMSRATAVAIRDWLTNQIAQLDEGNK